MTGRGGGSTPINAGFLSLQRSFRDTGPLVRIVLQLARDGVKGVAVTNFEILVFVIINDKFRTGHSQINPALIGFTLPVTMGR